MCVNLVVLRKLCEKLRFFGQIYTAGTNFTQTPVVTVATNINSEEKKKHYHADMISLNEKWHLLGTKIGMSVNEVEKGCVSVLAANV